MSENETLADIRKESEARFRELLEKHVDGLGHIQAMQQFNQVFDRIEAATQREREATGNSAELRKALILCVDSARCIANHAGFSSRIASEALVIVNAAADALAAPARNCDVYDKEEVRMAYHLHGDGLMTMQAFANWLFATATTPEQESEVQG